MKFNKRGVVNPILIVIIIIGSLFAAQQVGLFATFFPQVGQPSDTIVFPVYFDEAGSSADFACDDIERPVIFRADFLPTISFSHIKGDVGIRLNDEPQLTRFTKVGSSGSNSPSCEFLFRNSGGVLISYGPYSVGFTRGEELRVCKKKRNGIESIRFERGGSIETTLTSIDPTREVLGGEQPVLIEKFVCENGNVVLKECNAFGGSTLIEDCLGNGCSFIPNYDVGGENLVPVVKCSPDFIPNKEICVGNTKYNVNNDGSSFSSESCAVCNQINDFEARCDECGFGEERCDTNVPQICVNGRWQQERDACIGDQQCVVENNDAQCTVGCIGGQHSCSGDEITECNVIAQEMQGTGLFCDGGCLNGQCLPVCDADTPFFCDGGVLETCSGDGLDDEDSETIFCFNPPGACLDSATCSLPISWNSDNPFCYLEDIYRVVSNPDRLDTGGFDIQLEKDCVVGCNEDTNQCEQIHQCEGNEGQNICISAGRKEQCSESGEEFVDGQGEECLYGCTDGTCNAAPSVCNPNVPFNCEDGVLEICSGDGKDPEDLETVTCLNGCADTETCALPSEWNPSNDFCFNEDVHSVVEDLTKPETGFSDIQLVQDCVIGCEESIGECIQVDDCIGNEGEFVCININERQQCSPTGEALLGSPETCELGCNTNTSLCNDAPEQDCIGNAPFCNVDGNVQKCNDGFSGAVLDFCEQGEGEFCEVYLGESQCLSCISGDLQCESVNKLRCENPTVGFTNIGICDFACVEDSQALYCDDILISIDQFNFFSNEDIVLSGTVTGSHTGNPLESSYAITTNIPGFETVDGLSASGKFSENLARPGLGTYTGQISVESVTHPFTLTVTNDFVVRWFGPSTVAFNKISTEVLTIEVVDSNGNAPDSVSVTGEGITVTATPTTVGKWDLSFEASVGGIYELDVVAVEGAIALPSQKLQMELTIPVLRVSTTMPTSSKKGKQTFDVEVSPSDADANVTASMITPSSTSVLELVKLSSGKYRFEFDFSEEGTYTLEVTAYAEGFDSSEFSHSIQISTSGKDTPPGSGDDGGVAEAPTKDGEPTEQGIELPLIGKISQTGLIIIIIAIVLLVRGRKK